MIQDNITAVVIGLSAVLAVTVVLMAYLLWRIRRLESECELLLRDARGQNFVEIVNENIAQVDRLIEEVDGLSERYALVLRRMAGTVQHIGVVRFDAFRDLGGMLSFAVALLDDRGNGLVFSSIYGRSESRTYAKPIVERGSKYELSPEEKEAIRLSMQSKEKGALPVEARDIEHEERIANLRLFHDKELQEQPVRAEARAEPEERRQRPKATPRKRPPAKPAAPREPKRGKAAGAGAGGTRARAETTSSVRQKHPGRVAHVGSSERRPPEGSPAGRRKEPGPGHGKEKQKQKAERDRKAPGETVKKPAQEKSSGREQDSPRLNEPDTPVERPRNRKPGDS
ncbi:MAG: DUF4446 family protein [Actinomycetia bacterium]|nr:DUF4446 family protein [Actinomycetes bacterium]